MSATILLALIFSTAPPQDAATGGTPSGEFRLSVDNMSSSGNAIKITGTNGHRFECEVEGEARFAIGHDGDTDISIAAEKLIITRNAASQVKIQGMGDCKLTDSEHTCTADRMQIHMSDEVTVTMTGRCRVEFANGDARTTIESESILVENGTFITSGPASVRRSQ